MSLRLTMTVCSFVALTLTVGCVPETRREPTTTKTPADVVITYDVDETPEPEASPPAVEASSPSGGQPSQEQATPEMAKTAPSESATPKAATVSTTPVAAPKSDYSGPGKFVGRVVVQGAAPKLPDLLAKGAPTKDPVCSEEAVPNEAVVVSDDGGLANVFVYMKKAPKTGVPAPEGDAPVLDQKGCVFLPHAKVVRAGQPVVLKNSDPVAHNVNVKGFQNQYNSVVPAGGSLEHTFELPDNLPVTTGCDFHTFMTAYILIVDHPWAAVTDENGNFEIPNLPEGEWDFIVWHEAVGYVERSIKVTGAANLIVEKTFEVPAAKLTK